MSARNWFGDFTQDWRYASRLLRSNPLFTAVVVLTLGLGIGANTAIFSVMNAVVLRNMPVPDPQRLVHLRTSGWPDGSNQTGNGDSSFSMYAFQQLRQERRVFSDLMAFVPLAIGKTAIRVGSEPEEANANMVSGNFFSGLGVKTICGRAFSPEDETNHTQVAVLGHGYWNRRFGASCSAMGQTLFVRGVPFTIIGVAARDFIGVESSRTTDLWIPLQDRPDLNAWGTQEKSTAYSSPEWWFLMMIGRLAPGVSEEQALAQLNPIFQRAAFAPLGRQPRPGERLPNMSFASARGMPGLREAYLEPLKVLLAMVVLVLLIACGNVAMLLSARNAARQREFGIRMAVGGGRVRLFRQLLAESLLLVAVGAGMAWIFGLAATEALTVWSGLRIDLSPDRTVMLFTLGISLAVGVTFGLAPLRGAVRVPLGIILKTSSSTANVDRDRMIGRKAAIATQVSLCVILVAGAGLLVRTLFNLQNVNLGMRSSGLLVFGISPQQRARSQATTIQFYEALMNRMRTLPGVESATLMQNRIGSGWSNNTMAVVDGKRPEGKSSRMRWNAVGSDFFRTLGTQVLFGRDFTEADSANAPKSVIVNETFVKRYLPDQNPIGHTVALSIRQDAPRFTIVGVAADSKYTGVREGDIPMAYFSYKQVEGLATMHIELRTSRDPGAQLPAVQRVVREFAPDLPLLNPMTQQSQFEESFSQERLFARLAMCFGLLATLLVATGIYGTLAYRVSRRTSEIGIRMALGAQRGQVLWMVLRESLLVCCIGIGVGLPLAIAATRFLRSMLYGVAPEDPVTFAAALTGVTAVALVASLIPARRAASTSPVVALRYE